MTILFTKASACGNDFLIIDGRHAPADVQQFSKKICDRHNGVGGWTAWNGFPPRRGVMQKFV